MRYRPETELSFLLGLLLISLAGVYGCFRPRWRRLTWLALVLLGVPPLALALRTTSRYFNGTARLREPSLSPRFRELENLDPVYRVFVEYAGIEIWWRWAAKIEQATLLRLFSLFGPMAGSYQGPYPSRDVVRTALLEAQTFALPGELSAPITVDGQAIRLAPAAQQRALAHYDASEGDQALALARAGGSCLLLGYWFNRWYHAELIDAAGFGWFAHYVFEQDEADALPARRNR